MPVRGSRRPQRVLERGREQRGDDHRLRVGAVEPLQIRFGPEAAERSVEGDEEPLDGVVFERGRAADHDLAAHRPESACAHDVCVDACGGLDGCEGATEPDWKKESALPGLLRDPCRDSQIACGSGGGRCHPVAAVSSADEDRDDTEDRHRRARRRDLEEPGAAAGGSEAGGG